MKISIITVVRNNIRYVEDCVRSVVTQSYGNIEYIIIDGRSTDGTLAIVDKYKNKIARIISEKDYGHIYAMNKGLKLATGDIIGFLHSDDFYAHANVIKNVAHVFTERPSDSVYGDLIYVAKDNPNKVVRYWRSGSFNIEKIEKGWMPPHPAFFVKRKVYEKYGFLRTDFKISMDYEIVLRFLYKYRISASYLPEALVKMRWGGVSNRGLGNIITKTIEDYKACCMYDLGAFTVFRKNMSKIPQFFVR